MISSTILTLIVIPAIYGLVKEFALRKQTPGTSTASAPRVTA